jgi:aminocarboxymuconate-semialdehyde decarboxylase
VRVSELREGLDVHTHAMPVSLLQRLESRGLARLHALGERTVFVYRPVSGVSFGTPIPCPPEQYDVPTRLAAMDAAGVARHAVSLPPFLSCATAAPGTAADVVRLGNDELARYVAGAPERLIALGTVPVGLPGAAEEARRVMDELGMPGVCVGGQGNDRELDDPVNEDLWALLAERRAFVLLHPNVPVEPRRTADYWMTQLVGYPMETALAAARLVLGGVLERHALELCLAHGGGCVPSLRDRLDLGWERKAAARARIPRLPSDYLARLYYDTAVFSGTQLRRLVEDVGTARVMLGSDFPFDLSDREPIRGVRALGLSEADTWRLTTGNAAALLLTREVATRESR